MIDCPPSTTMSKAFKYAASAEARNRATRARPATGRGWQEPHAAMQTSGLAHIAFEVDDLDAAFAATTAAGGAEVWTPRPSPEAGRRMAFIHDLDGNLIELIGPLP